MTVLSGSPTRTAVLEREAYDALGAVLDPELDEPITGLGFVRSLLVTPTEPAVTVEVHLRLPTSFCSPNFAYLMASDAKDALTALAWTGPVRVELDDHHDSDLINAGLATDAGYLGTFGNEAERSLDELRATFRRKAHTAAMERCLTELLRSDPQRSIESLGSVVLSDLSNGRETEALLRRRTALGLTTAPSALVLVDDAGAAYDDIPMALRRARATRVSIDGNAHFCRGLLRTRYPGSEHEQNHDPTFIPITSLLKESPS